MCSRAARDFKSVIRGPQEGFPALRSKAGKDEPLRRRAPRPQRHSAAREEFYEKKASVRRTFYRSFCLLIVLPLVAVAAAGSALLYRKLLADAREMVQMRQEAVSSALTQDVRQASLQLAHFLLSEDSEGLALVDELPASSSRRYETAARLESIFDYYRLTGRRLEALHLYLTDGTSYQLYTGLAVPQNRVKEAAWYRAARQRPGRSVWVWRSRERCSPAKTGAEICC